MNRPITSPKEMNRVYEEWYKSRSQVLYDRLLQSVMDNAFNRFVREDGEGAAEDIASLVGAKVYRALPGYSGPSPLRPYDPSRGTFNAYQSTMARTTRLDYVTRRSASGIGESDLLYSSSDGTLESLYYAAQGNGKRRETPNEDDYMSKRDPRCKVSLGNSVWNE